MFQDILKGASADGTGQVAEVRDFMNCSILLSTSGNASGTVLIQGSLSEKEPDFSSSPSATNPWDYIAVYDYSNPNTVITGPTGISASGSDIVKNLLVNVDGISWLNCLVTSYSAGEFNATFVGYSN